ncbi:acyltransferase [Dietzia maris]
MLSSLTLWFANVVSRSTPTTRLFGLRARLYRAAGVRLGRNVRICGGAQIIHPNAEIGDDTWVGYGCVLIPTGKSAVTIGARCDLAPQILLVVGSHEVGGSEQRGGPGTSAPIVIGDGTWVGARSVVLGGVSVGGGSIIAAASTVTSSTPPNHLIAGTPAVAKRDLDAAR